jgi:hypothetical protein
MKCRKSKYRSALSAEHLKATVMMSSTQYQASLKKVSVADETRITSQVSLNVFLSLLRTKKN